MNLDFQLAFDFLICPLLAETNIDKINEWMVSAEFACEGP